MPRVIVVLHFYCGMTTVTVRVDGEWHKKVKMGRKGVSEKAKCDLKGNLERSTI
jgi:redox-sensitive bicupin YhaK (pirin superfamily)